MVIGWRQFDTIESSFRQAGWAYSHDGGHSWVFPGVLEPGAFRSDPVLDADADGSFYFYSASSSLSAELFKSTSGGLSWGGPIPAFGGDKPWMAIDRTDGIGRGNVYVTWAGLNAGFARSLDGGATFTEGGSVASSSGTMCVDKVGALHVSGAGSSGLRYSRSTTVRDPSSTPPFFTFPQIVDMGGRVLRLADPNQIGLMGMGWIATDNSDGPMSGNVYMLATVEPEFDDDPAELMFVRSRDGGDTWDEPVRVNDDGLRSRAGGGPFPPIGGAWQWFGTMSVAPNGRIDVVWNDTRNFPDAPLGNLCELFYSFSLDGGETWSTNVPVSPMFDSHVGWPQQNKLGDYYHTRSDNLGVNVAYAATFRGEQDIYFLRIGPFDCNNNENDDAEDIAQSVSRDANANDIPDECEFRGDVDGDGQTTLRDVAAMQRCFSGFRGSIVSTECHLLDIDHDADVDLTDHAALLRVLGAPVARNPSAGLKTAL